MRPAELVMAIVMAIFSLYLMWKSAELPIGWIEGSGPGGGAFPFWLSAGMLLCCILITVRWFRRASAPSRSEAPYLTRRELKLFLIGAGSLTVLIGGLHVLGVYVMVPAFLIFHMRYLGGHGWIATASVAIGMPVFTFFFFEIALHITLPKGYTEPAFYPLYEFFLG